MPITDLERSEQRNTNVQMDFHYRSVYKSLAHHLKASNKAKKILIWCFLVGGRGEMRIETKISNANRFPVINSLG